jgi:hypothetical protein
MLQQAHIHKIARQVGIDPELSIYLEPDLLKTIEQWPTAIHIDPSYNEDFRMKEVLISVNDAIKNNAKAIGVYLLNAQNNDWKRIELYVKKRADNKCIVAMIKLQ